MAIGLANVCGRTQSTAEFIDDTALQDIEKAVFEFKKVFN